MTAGAPHPIAVVGATGTGKSELAIALARQLGGEIVNCDSMQLYRGMDIGTAKVPPGERGGVPHHLLDVWEVTETASVARFQEAAGSIVEELLGRGVTPVLVGGSMLYVQSLIDRWAFPATDERLREELEERLRQEGLPRLREELERADPEAAAAILPSDARRTVRALEVVTLTGRPFSASRPRIGAPRWGTRLIGVGRGTEVLDTRVRERTERMFGAGLVGEVVDLIGRGLRSGTTARRAIGYAQVLAELDAVAPEGAQETAPEGAQEAAPEGARGTALDATAIDRALEATYVATRRYVRRQRSWFARDERIHWVDADSEPTTAVLAERVLRESGDRP